jgi:predicted metal-dependent HD superfamily phosphohydrolase
LNEKLTDEMRRRWQNLCRRIAPTGGGACDLMIDELVRAYCEPHRHYHNLDHIAQCLQLFDDVRGMALDPDACEVAFWFHDVVYDPHRKDNELRSAQVADESLHRLGAPRTFVEQVHRLIVATTHDFSPPADDIDACLVTDIDLVSLGLPPDVFDAHGAEIRQEFAHVSDGDYRAGRIAMMRKFLARPAIYSTDVFRASYERAARANIQRLLDRLEQNN